MNSQQLQQTRLSTWATLIQEQQASGLTIRDWCEQKDVSFHAYNYLKHKIKKEYVSSMIPEIVPLKVDDFFAWAKEAVLKLPSESATAKGLSYCINQEQFMRVFLDHGDVPMDNNLAEQAIRPFTLGRKNWVNIATPKGAGASAILYSLVETAKANNLRLNDYFEFLLSELCKHQKNEDKSYIQDLLPWSKKVQKEFRIGTKVKKSVINVH